MSNLFHEIALSFACLLWGARAIRLKRLGLGFFIHRKNIFKAFNRDISLLHKLNNHDFIQLRSVLSASPKNKDRVDNLFDAPSNTTTYLPPELITKILSHTPSSVKSAVSYFGLLEPSQRPEKGLEGISDLINLGKKSFAQLGYQNVEEVEEFLKIHGEKIKRVELGFEDPRYLKWRQDNEIRLENLLAYCPNLESLPCNPATEALVDALCKIKSLKSLSLNDFAFTNGHY